MRVIEPHVVVETDLSCAADVLKRIERAGRTCYQSEWNVKLDSAPKFIAMILKRGHESVIEHESVTVRVVCDRGVTHEIVRQRLCSFSQESTRYCNYSGERFGGEVTFVRPPWVDLASGSPDVRTASERWRAALVDAEHAYFQLLDLGWKPEQARSVLPNSLKTEIVWTANLREWRLIFRLRTTERAHPQMRQVMVPLRAALAARLAPVFDDLPPAAAVDAPARVYRRDGVGALVEFKV